MLFLFVMALLRWTRISLKPPANAAGRSRSVALSRLPTGYCRSKRDQRVSVARVGRHGVARGAEQKLAGAEVG